MRMQYLANLYWKIIPLIDEKSKEKLEIRKGVDEDVRNVKGYGLSLNSPTNIFYWNFIKSEIEKIYSHYKFKFPFMTSNKINQIDLLKYNIGGKYLIEYMNSSNFSTIIKLVVFLQN